MKIIEFFGIPGVGKSYMAKTTIQGKAFHPLDIYEQSNKLLRIFKKTTLIIRHFPTAISSFLWARKFVSCHSSMGVIRRCKVTFNWVFIDSIIRDAAQGQHALVVLDQGITQGLWSTHFGTNDKSSVEVFSTLISNFLQKLPITEWIIVHVVASKGIVKARLANRKGHSPLDQDFAKISEAICAEQVVEKVLEKLIKSKDIPKVQLVNVTNDGSEADFRFHPIIKV